MKKLIVCSVVLAGCGGGDITTALTFTEDPVTKRIIGTNKLVPVECPAVAERWLVAGQSNAANCGQNNTAATDARVIQQYENKCYVAASPMLGATCGGANAFQQVALDYVKQHNKTVVLSFYALGGQPIAALADQVKTTTSVDRFIWQQGEADAFLGTSTADYTASFYRMLANISAAKVHVARSTICANITRPDTPTAQAQALLQAAYPGPNTDAISLDARFRLDACHFSGEGITEFSKAWQQVLD